MATVETREFPNTPAWTFESDELLTAENVEAVNAHAGWEKYRVIA